MADQSPNPDHNHDPRLPPPQPSPVPVPAASARGEGPIKLQGTTQVPLPRVVIRFCVQCKWNLRAAYYAQELLQTFSLALGEVALVPSTSGTFVVAVVTAVPARTPTPASTAEHSQEKGPVTVTVTETETVETIIWDRRVDGGFPETKELKRRVRDLVEPGRGLGHVDRDHGGEKEKREKKRGVDEVRMGQEKEDEVEKKEECVECQ